MAYDLIPISLLLIIAYLSTYVLYKKKIIRQSFHVRMWDVLILISFLVSAGLGIIIVALIEYNFTEYGITSFSAQDMLFWHVEIGIAMIAIAVFHIHSHWRSFMKTVF